MEWSRGVEWFFGVFFFGVEFWSGFLEWFFGVKIWNGFLESKFGVNFCSNKQADSQAH